MKKLIPLFLILILAGCQVPQWRVFKAKVPEPIAKEEKQVEAERKAADLLARTITEPKQMIAVAQKLSESLGAPDKQIDATDLNKARDEALVLLLKGVQRQQEQLEELNARLAKYEGKAIEGTGFNLFGLSPVVAIALAFFFPSAVIPFLFSALRKAKGTLTAMVEGVEAFKTTQETPSAVTTLESSLSRKMDSAHKALVKKIKAKL